MPPDVLVDLTPLDSASRYRGIGRYVLSLAHAIADLPPEKRLGLEIVGLTGHGPDIDRTLRYTGDPEFKAVPLGHRAYQWRRRFRLGSAVSRTGARLFHHTDPSGTPLIGRTPRIVTGYDLIPLVLHEHYLSSAPGRLWMRRTQDARRYRSAHRIVAISEATKTDLVNVLGIDPERIDVTLLGVDHGRFHPTPGSDDEDTAVRRALGVDRPFLLYFGAWEMRKRVAHLVESYAQSSIRGDVALVLAGRFEQAGKAAVAEIVARHGLSPGDVVLAGYVDEDLVPAAYRACLAHVFPSIYEGFGLPVVEAMACGAPTITTSRSSLAEVAGDAALLISADDVDETRTALETIVENVDEHERLRRAGLERAAEFTWGRCAEETVASYRRALES